MFELMILLKLIVAVAVVITLTIITERVSPKLAGILAGIPTGSVITLFFIGLDNGTAFASKSATYNMMGLVAMQSILFFYYISSLRFKKHGLLFAAICSVAGYFLVAYALRLFAFDLWMAILLPLISIPVFTYLFKQIDNTRIENPAHVTPTVLAVRAVAAAVIILAVIEAASLVGPEWAGLFTAFPTTTFPLIRIIHYTYGAKHVHTIIKNFPVGLVSLLAYSLTVSFAYPALGIYYGTVVALAVAVTVCALLYVFYARKSASSQS